MSEATFRSSGVAPFPALAVLAACAACGDPTPAAGVDAGSAEVDAGTGLPEVDAGSAGGLACCPSGVCGIGQTCFEGACHTVPGSKGCYRTSECLSGQACVGAVACPCGDPSCTPEVGSCRWPAGCCNGDSECQAGEACLSGICYAQPAEGSCYDDTQCQGGLVCESEAVCACGKAGCTPAAGHCAIAGVCCAVDAECGPAGRCIEGACTSLPEAGACYGDEECETGLVCAGAQRCGCKSSCAVPTTPGRCVAAEAACCLADECGLGALCVEGEACLEVPAEGRCWVDAHCGLGRQCVGASVCPCGATCDAPDALGTCRTLALPCWLKSDCPAAMRCVVPDSAWCPVLETAQQGVCVAEVDEGCWASEDCLPYLRCSPDRICTAEEGCDEPNEAGHCTSFVKEGDCCVSHQECGPDYQCRNSTSFLTCPPDITAVCLPEPDFGESCWNYLDCPAGMVCNKVHICGCNARCYKSHEGFCESAAGNYCNGDFDCGQDYTCAVDQECELNPCAFDPDCPTAGRCQPKAAGCWSHYVCPSGEYCKGLKVCPSDASCPDTDKAGSCTKEGGLGECCDSYLGCAPALRCISAVTKSGCALDISSVCVPFGQFNETCYTDTDCAENRKCEGQKVCACGACNDPPAAGSCVLK